MQYKGTDKMQHLHIHTKADGKTKTHHYENPHRNELTRVTYSDGEPQRSFTYHTSGLAHTAANANSTITWGYDTAGRKTSETQALQGVPGSHTFAYFYDGDGNLDSHTRPDGSIVDYGYDLRNLLKDITADTAPPVAAYTYNGRNQLHQTGIEDGNLFTATRSYDGAGRLSGISNGALDTTGYTLSPDGRRTGITRNGQSETYGYDTARQVESATYGGLSVTQNWNYDAAANRSSATTNGVTTSYFANAVNEYTSVGSFNPTHDPNGNLLTGQVRPLASPSLVSCVFSWNIHNEMTAATNANGDTAEYQYDALGRRTKRTETISGVTTSTWFLINGWNVELEYEFGAYARRLTWGQDLSQSLQGAGGVGGLVMSEELPTGGGAPVPSFPTYDGNGNITAWVNSGGTVTARQRYDAFGNVIEQTGTAPSRYGFSTKPIELVTGFLYYGYRYYDAVTGRWPSRDPIEEMGGVNMYGFVGNNGINEIDILGLKDLDCYPLCGDKVSCGTERYERTVPGNPSAPTTVRVKGTWRLVGKVLQTTAGPVVVGGGPSSPLDVFAVNQWDEIRTDTLYREQTRTDTKIYRKWCTIYSSDYTLKCDGWVRREESVTVTTRGKSWTENVRRIVRTTHKPLTGWAGPIIATDYQYYGGYKE